MSSRLSVRGPLAPMFESCHERLFGFPGSELLLNPYADEDPSYDLVGAATIRQHNLARYFDSYRTRPEVVIVAEAPGPWGCRFSGVPITSEEQLLDPEFPLGGEVSGSGGVPHSEYSARIFWRVMAEYFPRFVVWNALPLHPHREGEPMSIRTPRVSELRLFASVTGVLVSCVRSARVVALGRKAETQLGELGLECTYVRHPSQGGATAFEEGMRMIFGG